MHLEKVLLGTDHVILQMESYDMSYRQYLRNHRDYRQINRILIDVAKGLKELHAVGYVHRDLKPENIVVNLRPLSVRIIDFNMSFTKWQATQGTQQGTPGYLPLRPNLKDGHVAWDIWALGAIALESDMEVDEYMRINCERGSIQKAEKHLQDNKVCKHLKALVRGTVMRQNLEEMIGLDEVIKLLERAFFAKR
jgi:serine/threonine protein kinase